MVLCLMVPKTLLTEMSLIYTRLASHYDWLLNELPDWPDSKILDDSGWIQNPWLGILRPGSDGWFYHFQLGWIYFPSPKGNFSGAGFLLNKWFSDEVFPYAYCLDQTSSFWIYLLLESNDGLSFQVYDFSTKSWKTTLEIYKNFGHSNRYTFSPVSP